MFWNTLMLFFNKLQETKEEYANQKLEAYKEEQIKKIKESLEVK